VLRNGLRIDLRARSRRSVKPEAGIIQTSRL
jgi:hypothetical protein